LLGSVVADRYHIIKKLGEGGMGTVYLAEHVKMGRKSALKVMNPGMNSDPDAIARFNREASNASRLSHPNICGIYDFGETPDGLIYLAMEFIEGKALTDLIEVDGSLAPARAASIVHQTGDALQVAHDAGIVHRDLKPDNIMVTKNRDGSDLVKVVDFGIAKASSSDAQKVTKTGMVVGTPEYMSPEQLSGDKLDGRSDIYSLALVAFNCLTGKLPFPSETAQEAMIMRLTDRPRMLSEIRPDIAWPEKLQEVMDRGLARDADERYQSAAQFGRDFAEAVSGMSAVAASEGATMVIGAANVSASAAKSNPVPATRVAGRDDAKSPARASAAAPAALQKKSNMIPMAVGGVAVVIAGYFGVTKLRSGGDVPAAADSSLVAQGKVADAPTSQPTPTPETVTPPQIQTSGSTTQMNQPVNPGTRPSRSEKQVPAQTAPAPTPTTPMARISSWITELQADGVTRARARAILGDVESIRPTLSGTALSESWFVAVLANIALEDQEGSCAAARQLKNLTRDQSRQSVADQILPNCS
jgi:serine/threonine-protein kinase